MPLYRVQVELAMVSGVPEDKSTNVWHFIADDLTALDLAIVQVTTFYAAIDGQLSNLVAASGHRVRAYDLADPEPRAPVRDFTFAGLVVGGATLPPEMAIAVSYQGPRQSGVPQARRRGRLFFGPLTTTGVDGAGRYTPARVTAFADALQDLLDASVNATTWAWAVYSRVNEAAIEATNGWVDNAPDVQRRRGLEATARTLVEGVIVP